MHLCFITEGYPTPKDPFMPFIREFASELVKQGVKVSVIAPQSITRSVSHKLPIRPKKWEDCVSEYGSISIYQPLYITFSKAIPSINFGSMILAVKKAYKNIKEPVDALYCYFWHMGVVAAKIQCNKPIFIACGESVIEVRKDFSEKEINDLIRKLTGVIYVGTKSLKEAEREGLQKETPYIIAPNGYNQSFCKKDQRNCRELLGWPQEAFIVTYVGSFNSRKGVDRLSAALSSIDKTIYSCFIGSGEIEPKCKNILYCGKVEHDRIPIYLNASDVFVLPTNNEGCCNAIVEALACGLPIISSNQSFNADIIDKSCSIQINPMDVYEISRAILSIESDDVTRTNLSEGSLVRAEKLTIEMRAKNVLTFIKNCLREN